MNILFISHRLYPCVIGGAELFNNHLIRSLSAFCNVFVVTCCKEKIGKKIEHVVINPRKFGIMRFSIPLEDSVEIIKRRKIIDLIHVTYMPDHWMRWIVYPLMKKAFGIPYVISIRGGGLPEWKPEFVHRFLFKNADAIIGVSEMVVRDYKKISGRNVKYIPSGLPFKQSHEDKEVLREKYGISKSNVIIFTVGSIKKIKGSNVLLDSFMKLGRKFIEQYSLKLIFVGDGEMRNKLEIKVKEENYGSYVIFLGNIPHERIPSVFKMGDIFVLPSLFEGTSNAMLEAMFNAMPIIGSDTTGINNIIEHGKNGLLFKVSNWKDLKDKIVYLVENKNIAEKIACEAKKTYEDNYNFKTVVKQYIETYKEVVNNKKVNNKCVKQNAGG